jgi:hypothetical protein
VSAVSTSPQAGWAEAVAGGGEQSRDGEGDDGDAHLPET